MGEEFQAGICGESWWNINSTRNSAIFPLMSQSISTCSTAANDAGNYNTWQNDLLDLKEAKSCAEEDTNNFVSNGFVDGHKAQQSGTDSIFMEDSTLQMMASSVNWNQSLFSRCDSSNNSQIQKDWSEKNFSSADLQGNLVSTTVDLSFKEMNQEFSLQLDEQSLMSSITTSSTGLSYGNINYPAASPLMQGLYEYDHPRPAHLSQPPQQNNSLFTNPCMSTTTTNYGTCSSPTSMPKKQQQQQLLHFTNNTPFWNASAEALDDIRAGVVFANSSQPQPQPQYQTPTFQDKTTNCSTTTTLLNKFKREESPEAKKSASEPAIKRPRIETPSPLPTFKVRKEKLGDRITALQQLVSPFGKTDTASVLHEAIDYIKFLHDQVNVLSTPYMKNGAPIQHHQGCDNVEDSEGGKELRNRGLCLVPIASTFPVANETSVDFWTPTFGGALLSR